jgi:C-terminal processing protease CtpA/Prc
VRAALRIRPWVDTAADVLVAIDNVHVSGKSMDQVAALIRGSVGSSVSIDILRKGQVHSQVPTYLC